MLLPPPPPPDDDGLARALVICLGAKGSELQEKSVAVLEECELSRRMEEFRRGWPG